MSLKLGTQDIAGISQNTKYNAHHLLDFKWTDCIMNDVSWLRADTFSWQSGDVYTSAYNHLVQDIQGITAETETIGSYTVTFYRATDGHKVCLADQEQTVLNIYNSYGIAWYYILDTTNTQFKLPRTKYGFEGLRTNVGDKIDESLPTPSHTHTRGTMNITGSFTTTDSWGNYCQGYSSGAFTNWNASRRNLAGSNNSYENSLGGLSFDASRNWSGSTSQPNGLPSTYQDNAPVQERATQMYLYFYVGDYTQTAIEQTAGLNSELFNGKADLNLSNINATGQNYVASLGVPDYNNPLISPFVFNTVYQAPKDGIAICTMYTDTNKSHVTMYISDDNSTWETLDFYGIDNVFTFVLPLPKSYYFKFGGTGNSQIYTYLGHSGFYPLKGAN